MEPNPVRQPPPIHTYNSGQPYLIARGRNANRSPVEYAIRKGHSILRGRPTSEDFLACVERELKIRKYSPKSVKGYLSALRGFLAWFGAAPNCVNVNDVRNYLEFLVDAGAGSSHLAVTISAIRTAFDKFCCRDVTLGLATPRRKRTQPVVLSQNEVLRILGAAPTRTVKLAIGIMYAAGIRNSELCRLRVRDLDFERGNIRVVQGKGASDRIVMLPESFRSLLKATCVGLAGEDWIFQSPAGRKGRHLSPRTLQRWVATATQLAGITKQITPHSFRHAFATHLLESGTDIRVIQKLLGHQRLETTTIYTRVARKQATNVTSPLDQLELSRSQPHSASHVTTAPKPTKPMAGGGEPVGSLRIELLMDSGQQAATVKLHVLSAREPVLLDGIRVCLDDRKWVRLDVPMLESWHQQIARLPRPQQKRIQSPEFYENLRGVISQRFLAAISQASSG